MPTRAASLSHAATKPNGEGRSARDGVHGGTTARASLAWPLLPLPQPVVTPVGVELVRYVSIAGAAEALAVCPATIRRAIAGGELTAIRPGGQYRISIAEFERYCGSRVKPIRLYSRAASQGHHARRANGVATPSD